MIKQLYKAYFKLKDFQYRSTKYKNVTMTLFKKDLSATEKKELPLLIKNYKKMSEEDKKYAESVAEELFTKTEITQMTAFFKSFKNTKLQQHKVKIPVNTKTAMGILMGVGAIPVGGGQGFYMFSEDKDYPLKFKVWGYYDLRQQRLASKNDIKSIRKLLDKGGITKEIIRGI